MVQHEQRTNWVYAAIGCALVIVVAGGFVWLDRRVSTWERMLERQPANSQQATSEAAASEPETEADEDMQWATAIVRAVDEGFAAAEARELERDAELLRELTRALDKRRDASARQDLDERTGREEMATSILDEAIRVVDERIEQQAQTTEHRHAKTTMARAMIRTGLGGALAKYRTDMGDYPTALDGGLLALVQGPPDDELIEYWDGPYLQNPMDLLDPWGKEFFYEYPGDRNADSFDLASAGPDAEFGTSDDIANWLEVPANE